MTTGYLKLTGHEVGEFASGDKQLRLLMRDERTGREFFAIPAWLPLLRSLREASCVEGFNAPGSPWLAEFADTVRLLAQQAGQCSTSAIMFEGELHEQKEGELLFVEDYVVDGWRDFRAHSYPAAFPTDPAWLKAHLNRRWSVLVVNELVVELTPLRPPKPNPSSYSPRDYSTPYSSYAAWRKNHDAAGLPLER